MRRLRHGLPVVLALVVVGCGGSDSGADDVASPAEQLGSVCATAERPVTASRRPSPTALRRTAAAYDRVGRVAVAGRGAPERSRAMLEQVTGSADRVATGLRNLATAIERRSDDVDNAGTSLLSDAGLLRDQARAVGVKCGRRANILVDDVLFPAFRREVLRSARPYRAALARRAAQPDSAAALSDLTFAGVDLDMRMAAAAPPSAYFVLHDRYREEIGEARFAWLEVEDRGGDPALRARLIVRALAAERELARVERRLLARLGRDRAARR